MCRDYTTLFFDHKTKRIIPYGSILSSRVLVDIQGLSRSVGFARQNQRYVLIWEHLLLSPFRMESNQSCISAINYNVAVINLL